MAPIEIKLGGREQKGQYHYSATMWQGCAQEWTDTSG